MKRTKIKYRDLGDKVKVVGIENCASVTSLKKILNEKSYDKYFNMGLGYYRKTEKNIFENWDGVVGYRDYKLYALQVGVEYPSKYFYRCVEKMKRAGDRLTRIIAEEKAKRVHEVVI
jgi:hypothetical protein